MNDLDQYDSEPEPLARCGMVLLQPRYIMKSIESTVNVVKPHVIKRMAQGKVVVENMHYDDTVVHDRETGEDKIIYPAVFWKGDLICERTMAVALTCADMNYHHNVKAYPDRFEYNPETDEYELIVG